MKKWCKAVLFVIPLLSMVAAVNWYVDSYAYLRVTYDEIGEEMVRRSMNVTGLEESDFNDRKLLLACLQQQETAKEVIIAGSSRVMNFEHEMFGTDSFYNTGLSESTLYDLLAVVGILEEKGHLPKKMVIGVDAFLFNTSHNNERWKELEAYAVSMENRIEAQDNVAGEAASKQAGTDVLDGTGGQDPERSGQQISTGRDDSKWLSLDYFRYNVTLLPERKRFMVAYTRDWETEQYLKHCDGSIAYQRELREVSAEDVEELTRQAIEEQVVYRMTDYGEIDERSMEMFDALIGWLQGRGVEVMLYLPPYSPMMYNYIESAQQYQITFQVEERIRQIASERQAALYGSYDPAGSGLKMTDLYDLYHIKTEKMMDTFYPVLLPD